MPCTSRVSLVRMNRLGAAEPAFAFFDEPQSPFDPTSLSALRTTERLDIRTLKSFGFRQRTAEYTLVKIRIDRRPDLRTVTEQRHAYVGSSEINFSKVIGLRSSSLSHVGGRGLHVSCANPNADMCPMPLLSCSHQIRGAPLARAEAPGRATPESSRLSPVLLPRTSSPL